jgi:hypothetical protein
LKVHLVSVRRALLDRLVEWTKRRGVPFRSKAEATPDWVAQVARLRGHQEIERWANAVSSAAFGRAQPEDAQAPELQPPSGPQVTNPALKQSES